MAKAEQGKWITIGGKPSEDGKRQHVGGDWSGGPVQAPQPTPTNPKVIRQAWERYLGRQQHAHGGGLFGGEDMQAREGFRKLPDGAGVLFVERQYRGQTGKIVRDEQHGNRVVAEIDNHPEWGLVPVSPDAIEPLQSHLSWRTEYASGPSEQQSLLSADMFLPPRKRAEDDDDFVPFSRSGKRENMNASWNRLNSRELQRRSDRVRRYSRDMGASPFDAQSFDAAEALDTATRGAEPSELERAIDEARQAVKDGKVTENAAIESLMGRFASGADSNAAKLLSLAIRRSLTSGRPVAAHFAELQQQQDDVPDEREVDAMRMQRDAEAIRYRRNTGTTQPEPLRYSRNEINLAAKLVSQHRHKISFDQAIGMIRQGR